MTIIPLFRHPFNKKRTEKTKQTNKIKKENKRQKCQKQNRRSTKPPDGEHFNHNGQKWEDMSGY